MKGRGFSPKSSKTRRSRQYYPALILTLLVVLLAGGAVVYWYLQPREVTTASGLRYLDEKVGSGVSPSVGRRVTVHYTGRLENGVKFDSSVDRGQPYEFTIGADEVIKGGDEGIVTMKVGGKRKLIVPPSLAYGDRGKGNIPPNSTLFFDVELLGVK